MTPVFIEIYDADDGFEELTDAFYLNHIPKVGEDITIGSRKLEVKKVSRRISDQVATSVVLRCTTAQKESAQGLVE